VLKAKLPCPRLGYREREKPSGIPMTNLSSSSSSSKSISKKVGIPSVLCSTKCVSRSRSLLLLPSKCENDATMLRVYCLFVAQLKCVCCCCFFWLARAGGGPLLVLVDWLAPSDVFKFYFDNARVYSKPTVPLPASLPSPHTPPTHPSHTPWLSPPLTHTTPIYTLTLTPTLIGPDAQLNYRTSFCCCHVHPDTNDRWQVSTRSSRPGTRARVFDSCV
jgi:hypothetical protein